MKISEKGISLIKEFEGCRLTAYQDAVGVWTIGYGTTNADKSITGTTIKKGLTITQKQAEDWLTKSIDQKYGVNVMKFDSTYHWNQNQYDALCSFAYNIGSIDQLVQNGSRNISQISDKITAYNKAGGKVLAGLTRRRQAEKKLFDTQVEVNKAEQKQTNTKKDAESFKSYKCKITAKSGLYIRKDANANSSKLGALTYGTVVTVQKEKNGWGQIKTTINKKSVTGWVYLRYVKKV